MDDKDLYRPDSGKYDCLCSDSSMDDKDGEFKGEIIFARARVQIPLWTIRTIAGNTCNNRRFRGSDSSMDDKDKKIIVN